jgi:hypothetical protein
MSMVDFSLKIGAKGLVKWAIFCKKSANIVCYPEIPISL